MSEVVNIDKKKAESSEVVNQTSEKTGETSAPTRRARSNSISLPRSPLAPAETPDKYAGVKDTMTSDQEDTFSEKSQEDKDQFMKETKGLNTDEMKMYNLENLTNLDSLLGTIIKSSTDTVKGKLLADVVKISNETLGFYGGTFGRFWSSDKGYKLRVLLKESARALAYK
ncbi:MAG: hypothetical protein WBA54_09895, partial [Acidaminobacteraceae bacterium]